MWPCMWLTPTSGMSAAKARAFAVATPIKSAPMRPGPLVTPIRSMSLSVTPASSRACWVTRLMFSRWWRDAISGTTPPNFVCMSICEEMTLDMISLPSATTASDVSSQLDSIPRVRNFPSFMGSPLCFFARRSKAGGHFSILAVQGRRPF